MYVSPKIQEALNDPSKWKSTDSSPQQPVQKSKDWIYLGVIGVLLIIIFVKK